MSSLQDSYMSERKAGVPKTRRQMMMKTNRTEPWLGAQVARARGQEVAL